MSLIVTVYTSEGIVMASDSRTTQSFKTKGETKSFPLSDNVSKTFVTKWNYGISTCGQASINDLPLSGYIQRFIDSYDFENGETTVEKFSNDLCNYFSALNVPTVLIFHVAGYNHNDNKASSNRVFRCIIEPNKKSNIIEISNNNYGAVWDGQSEVMRRLVKQQFLSPNYRHAKTATIVDDNNQSETISDVFVLSRSETTFIPEASIDFAMMTLQDAVDFARFAIRTTIDTQRFLQMEKTVGGPIDVLIIKPQDNIWVSHKELK